MKIREISQLLDAKLYTGEAMLEREVHNGFGCDLMSDVLAYAENEAVLLTGLVNPQVIRTAEMMDIMCLVFVRGKEPTEAMIKLAEERSIVLMSTDKRMFTACGILHDAGLKSGDE
ncbi:MAG: hypothetical protein IKV72_05230 [Firmicutes bacterium]|nr:hypothetical protein [Bacillota bacterium]MBR5489088.1 hypothetical protein [Bacillota bacterium]